MSSWSPAATSAARPATTSRARIIATLRSRPISGSTAAWTTVASNAAASPARDPVSTMAASRTSHTPAGGSTPHQRRVLAARLAAYQHQAATATRPISRRNERLLGLG